MFSFTNFLVIGWMFTAGWVPMDESSYAKRIQIGNLTYSDQDVFKVTKAVKISMDFNALFGDHINIRGSLKSWQFPNSIDDWTPYRIRYDVGMDISVFKFHENDFNIILSIDRYCSHPVNTWNTINGYVNEAYCEYSVSIKGNKNVF